MDRFGNVVTDYAGTVTFSTSDAGAGVFLPADYTFQPSDGGVARVAVLLQTAGDELITVVDGLGDRYTVTVTVI